MGMGLGDGMRCVYVCESVFREFEGGGFHPGSRLYVL